MKIINIVGDGACLFRAISFHLFGTQNYNFEVRKQIVEYVLIYWDNFSILSQDENGDNYKTKEEYKKEMLKKNTYGSICELAAAANIYKLVFEVYRNNEIYVIVGEDNNNVKKLKFTNNLSNGHFDVYI